MDEYLRDNQKQEKMNIAPAPKKLWNPISFLIISAVFSFLPTGILYALNWGRLGYKKKRNLYLIGSVLAFTLFCAVASFIPETLAMGFYIGVNIGAGSYFMQSQRKDYKAHIENGGKKASLLLPLFICIVAAAILIWALFMAKNIPDNHMMFGSDKLYYTDNVQAEDVRALGEYLTDVGLFADDNNPVFVKLDMQESIYMISLAIKKETLDQPDAMVAFEALTDLISDNLFDGNVQLVLSDNTFHPLKVLD